MSTPIDNGGPAFPIPLAFSPTGEANVAGAYFNDCDGMSIRDWFAGQALNGYLASWEGENASEWFEPHHVAKSSYAYADAMIAARKGGQA